MKLIGIIVLMISLGAHSDNYSKNWINPNHSYAKNLDNLIEILRKSNTGKVLASKLEKTAINLGKTIDEIVKPSDRSYTDSTIVRSFKENSPLEVTYNKRSEVYINTSLPTYYAVLDLAHELVHYLKRETLNPYIDEFTVSDFIKNTIEGKGGEVDAFLVECLVDEELFGVKRYLAKKCGKLGQSTELRREYVTKEFYKLGSYFQAFKAELEKTVDESKISEDFKYIGRDDSTFISSVHSMPYPLASFFEFQTIKGAACKNEKRRFSYINASPSRGIAKEAALSKFKANLKRKCKGFPVF